MLAESLPHKRPTFAKLASFSFVSPILLLQTLSATVAFENGDFWLFGATDRLFLDPTKIEESTNTYLTTKASNDKQTRKIKLFDSGDEPDYLVLYACFLESDSGTYVVTRTKGTAVN